MKLKPIDEYIAETDSKTDKVYIKCNSHRSLDRVIQYLGKENIITLVSFTEPTIHQINFADFEKISHIKGVSLVKKEPNLEKYRTPFKSSTKN